MIDSETNSKSNDDSYMYETYTPGVYCIIYFKKSGSGDTNEIIREEKTFDTREEARLWAASKGIEFGYDDPFALRCG